MSLEDKILKNAEINVKKINLDKAKVHGMPIDINACSKLLSLMRDFGDGSIKSVNVLPNFDDGAAPHRLPSGFVMLFDAAKTKVVAEAYPWENMYAGSMAFRIPHSELANSPFTLNGPTKSIGELSETLKKVSSMRSDAIPDGFVGIFSNEKRDHEDFEHDYYAVVRAVDSSLNETFGAALASKDRADNFTMHDFLHETAEMRSNIQSEQRKARATTISQVLSAYKIKISPEFIMGDMRHAAVENTFNTIITDEDSTNAALYVDAVPLFDSTLDSGLILGNTHRIGPVLIQGNSQGRGDVSVSDLKAFPSSVGTTVSPWNLKRDGVKIELDSKCSVDFANSPYSWDVKQNGNTHKLLGKNIYQKTTSESWRAYQTESGFSDGLTKVLRPLAVKLD